MWQPLWNNAGITESQSMSQSTPTPHQPLSQPNEPSNANNTDPTSNSQYVIFHPPWKIINKLPTLTKATLSTWLCSIYLTLKKHGLSTLIDQNFLLDSYSGAQKDFYCKAPSRWAAAILDGLNITVSQLIPATVLWNTSDNKSTQLQTTLTTDNELTINLLQSEVKKLTIDDNHTIHQNVEAHRGVRAKWLRPTTQTSKMKDQQSNSC